MTEKTLPASVLVLDYNLYPRHEVDTANIASMARAIEAGEELPPVAVDKESLRVVDGFHRVTVYQRIAKDYPVPVELVQYASEQEMLLDAMSRNARHGERLTRYDQARCALLADALEIAPDRVAKALAVTAQKLGELRTTKTAYDQNGKEFPIKGTVRHLAGSRFSRKGQKAAKRTGGMSIRFYADQITNAIRGEIIPWDDAKTAASLRELHTALDKSLRKVS